MFETLEADIVIMQELKIQRKDLRDDMVLVPGWDVYFSLPKEKKGYSGVAIYTRNSTCAPIRAEEGITGCLKAPKTDIRFRDLPSEQQIGGYPRTEQLSNVVDEVTLDSEGRCVILEFPAFVLLGVYSPANRDESRDEFRLGFLAALDARVRNLVVEGKQVILAGDLNVVRSELDTSNISETLRKNAMTMQEWMSMPSRRLFNQLIFSGTVSGERDQGRERPVLWDLTRDFHPTREGMNTCWDTKKNTRPANYGGRIDYILCSDGLKSWFIDSDIQAGLMGSDHCPVFAIAPDMVMFHGNRTHLKDIVNPSGMFQNGQRQRNWTQQDLLSLSAKLIPEFNRRRNIRDMFNSKVTNQAATPSSQPESNEHFSDSLDVDPAEPKSKVPSPDNTHANPLNTNGRYIEAAKATSTASSQHPRVSKRVANPDDSKVGSKRQKGAADSNKQNSKTSSGQKTLQAFFKSKSSRQETPGDNSAFSNPPSDTAGSHHEQSVDTKQPTTPSVDMRTLPATSSSYEGTSGQAEKVFDPIEAKESWSKLLGKRVVPRCEHNEPCISLTTKKAGINCGRSFYICPRPLGPSGEKEKDTEWRCSTFIWSSDWNGSQSQ